MPSPDVGFALSTNREKALTVKPSKESKTPMVHCSSPSSIAQNRRFVLHMLALFLTFAVPCLAEVDVLIIQPRTGFDGTGIKEQLQKILEGSGLKDVKVALTGPSEDDQKYEPSSGQPDRFPNSSLKTECRSRRTNAQGQSVRAVGFKADAPRANSQRPVRKAQIVCLLIRLATTHTTLSPRVAWHGKTRLLAQAVRLVVRDISYWCGVRVEYADRLFKTISVAGH